MTVFLRTILKRTSTEAHVYMRRHQGAKVEQFDVSNVIYHKFSHGAVSYMLNGENVNVVRIDIVTTLCASWDDNSQLRRICINFG